MLTRLPAVGRILAVALVLALAPASAFAAEAVRIACVGDSITFGAGIEHAEYNGYPAQLQALLGEGFDVRNFGVSSAGVCRSGIKGADWERFYLRRPEAQASLDFNPHVVVIALGINDIMHWDALHHEFADSYAQIIAAYRALPTRPRILIASPLAPLLRGHVHYNDPNLARLNDAVASVAAAQGVETFDLRTPFACPSGMFADLVHPNARGAGVIAETVHAALVGSAGAAMRPTLAEDFESFPAGPLQRQRGESGAWVAERGAAEVTNRFRHEGFHGLRLLGGEGRSVEWTPSESIPAGATLSFWAARWSGRQPFAFRLEARDAEGAWHELPTSHLTLTTIDENTKDFRSFVAVRLDRDAHAVRVTCTSPDKAGMLLDTWRVAAPMPDAHRAAVMKPVADR